MNAKWIGIPAIAWGCVLAVAGAPLAQNHRDADKPAKHKDLGWSPPDVNAPLRSLSSIPPCDVTKVLRQAGAHVLELTTNLENFTAQEKIEYEKLNQVGFLEESDSGVFDYVFAFEQRAGGARISREYRSPANGSQAFPMSGQDTGQVALGLIFHPNMQSDYDMSCEGLDQSRGQFAWVIQFQQRKDKPRRTLLFRTPEGSYAAMLKGRAWISMESEQVLRLETTLMKDIPEMNVQSSVVSVEYAPVEIQSRKLELWLPQRVEAYWQISNHRIILYHTFSNFKLFSVETEQNVGKPKQ
jgi:hypothetical protein